ncbi:MAG: slipin family protein [Candidatus Nanoarchaeia archaeon]|nr:slipin family protein [Candidatus Nanoarchaeia archaeon]
MIGLIYIVVLILLFLLSGLRVIYEYERGIVFTLGKFTGEYKAGLKLIIPIFQKIVKIDTRTMAVDVPKQDCITQDNVSVNVDAVLYYRVAETQKAVLSVYNYSYATSQLAQTTMRNVVGEVKLDGLLSNRDEISNKIREIIDEETDKWGIKVDGVELKHVELPESMKRMMAREAEAEREKRGVIIKSSGEIEAAKNLEKAAKILEGSDGAKYLRTLQTLSEMSSEPSTKYLMFPLDIMQAFEKTKK